MVWPTLGSRTAKEQNGTEPILLLSKQLISAQQLVLGKQRRDGCEQLA